MVRSISMALFLLLGHNFTNVNDYILSICIAHATLLLRASVIYLPIGVFSNTSCVDISLKDRRFVGPAGIEPCSPFAARSLPVDY